MSATQATKDPTVSKVNEWKKKSALPIEPDAAPCSILVCDAPWELTQPIGETIGVFDSAEQIMLWMLLLILRV